MRICGWCISFYISISSMCKNILFPLKFNEYTPPGSFYLFYIWRVRYIVILVFSKVMDWSNSWIKLILLEITIFLLRTSTDMVMSNIFPKDDLLSNMINKEKRENQNSSKILYNKRYLKFNLHLKFFAIFIHTMYIIFKKKFNN